jgi:carboxypeptidase Taq
MKPSSYAQLESMFTHIGHLTAAEHTLSWDRRTLMPPGGLQSRAKVLSALRRVSNEALCSPQIGELLAASEDESASLTPWQAANVREMRRAWRRATAVPASLQTAIAELEGPTERAWQLARQNNDFQSFAAPLGSYLQLQIEAIRIKSQAFGLTPYDALLDEHEPGMRLATLDPLLDDLARFLPEFLREVVRKQSAEADPIPLRGPFLQEKQVNLSKALAALIGFDFDHGRLDETAHPFTSVGVPGDIRITTRFSPDEVRDSITATIHETGHAMYELGLPNDWAFQPVGLARGGAMHESQALLYEMQASRSDEFLGHLASLLRQSFGSRDPSLTDENVLRVYRRVVPGPLRLRADEVTYPLHIILRYRLEREILDGSLRVAEIPSAWNALSQELLGVVPPTDSLGCLQDSHWVVGYFGYFPVYTLGALIAAQLFAMARREEPQLLPGLARGDFTTLARWTRAKVHGLGSFYSSGQEIIRNATGETLSTEPFKRHLMRRYLGERHEN